MGGSFLVSVDDTLIGTPAWPIVLMREAGET
jgi:hypothetical protein